MMIRSLRLGRLLHTSPRILTEVTNESIRDILLTKSLASKPSEKEYIRCTIFDKTGEVVVNGKEIKRSQFLKAHDLVNRDLRKITSHKTSHGYVSTEMVSSIFTRPNSILLNLLNVRAMIKSDMVVLFDGSSGGSESGLNESHSFSTLLKDLKLGLAKSEQGTNLPYEFRALETILRHVVKDLNSEMNVHATALQNILSRVEDSIESDNLRYLLIQSKKMTQFHRKAVLIRDVLDEVLSQDDDMNAFYLSEVRQDTNHEEIEFLLESYYVTFDEIVQKSQNLISQTKSTNEIINIILDSNRNELMLLSLKFAVGVLSMGTALYIAALYGMNLENFIEETGYGLPLTVISSSILLLALLVLSTKSLRNIQRITMTGRRDERR